MDFESLLGNLLKGILSLAFIVIIFVPLGTYGRITNDRTISYPLDKYAKIDQTFDDLIKQDWPDGIELGGISGGKNRVFSLMYMDSQDNLYFTYYEKDGKVNKIEIETDLYTKRDAKDFMEVLSRELSDKYTKGHGIRRYKMSRNYIYDKKQGVMMEIQMEKEFGDYSIHIYVSKYSFWKKIWRGFYWRFISLKRPGINIGSLFIPQ